MKKITLMIFMSLVSLCGYAQFPEGFEGGWPPPGWGIYDNGIGTNFTWAQSIAGNPTQPPHTGTHAAYLQKENVVSGIPEDWLTTPQFEAPANPQLRFWSRLTQPGNQGSVYRVLYSTADDQDDLASYTLLQEWTEDEINPIYNEYIERIVSLPASAAGQDIYLAFVMAGDDGDRWLVDDVNVVSQCLVPTTLGANSFALTSANLTWSHPGGASSFEIEVVDVVLPPTGVADYTSATTSVNATGLTADTDYKFYVRAVCGPGNTSEWVGPFFFSTVAPGATCNAPIIIPGASYSTTNNTSNFGDDYNGSPGATGCGTVNGYLNGDDVVYQYTAATTGNISINMSGTGAAAGMFVYTSCANIGVSCAAGGIGNATTPVNISPFAVTAGQTYYIVISTWATPQSTPYTLVIQPISCTPPVGLATTGIGQTSANLSWTNPTSATSWQVVIQAPGSGLPGPATPFETATTNTNYLADGLTQATPYEYYVRSDCGDGTFSAWAGPYLFNTTICEAEDQCNYTFVLTDSFGDGWNGNTMTVSQNGITVATLGPTFTTGGGPVNIVVPMCHDLPFQLYWNSGGNFAGEVGVSVRNSFDQTIFTKPSGTGVQNSLLYTGEVDCETPACLAPEDLEVNNAGTTSVELGWNGPATGNWVVYVVPTGDPAPTETTEGTEVTTNPYLYTGLEAGTVYDFYVMDVCSPTESSPWSEAFTFNTAVCDVDQQCTFTFTMIDTFGDGWNGNTMTVSQNGAPVATLTGPLNSDDQNPVTVSVQVCNGEPIELFWNAGGAFAGEVGISITNSHGQVVYTKAPGTGTQNSMLYTGEVDCDNPDCLPPNTLTAANITDTTADLGWTPNGGDEWEVYLVPSGDPAPTETSVGETSATTTFNATGLTEATTYVFYVRTVCADDETSQWVGPFTFITDLCPVDEQCDYTFIMTDSFGDGWNGNTMTVSQNGIVVATLTGPLNSDDQNPIPVVVPLCHDMPFELFWNAGGAFAGEVGIAIQNSFDQTFFTKPPGTGAQNTLLYSGTADCLNPLCLAPEALTATNITTTTADLGWAGPATGDWEVYVVPDGDPAPGDTTAGTAATANPFAYTGLEAGMCYDYYVRVVCSPTQLSDWAGPFSFCTDICEPAEQCLYDFVMTDSFGDGWNGNTMTISQNGIPVATLTGPLNSDDQNPITVQVPLCNGEPFTLYWNAGGAFAGEVGISIVNPFDQTLFTKPAGTGSQNTLLYTGMVDCDNPACLQPTALTVANIGATSVDLGWTPGEAETEWEVFVVPFGDPAPTASSTGTVTTDNPHTFEGLTAGTQYQFYVRAICSDTSVSIWSGPRAFYTAVCEPEEQCLYSFVMIDTFGDGWNGNTMTVSQNGVPVATLTGPTNADDQNPVTVQVPLCDGEPVSLFWNAGGAFAGEVGISIVDPWDNTIYTKAPGTGTQNSLLYTSTITCTPPPCEKPEDLTATDVAETSATLGWTETDAATEWEIAVLPSGSPEPTEDTDVTLVTDGPSFDAEALASGTCYVFYVRSVCENGEGYSYWAGPFQFCTLIENDECEDAVSVPVNPGSECIQTVPGTVTGATPSLVANTCFGAADDDVWFEFTATTTEHAISLINVANGTTDLFHAVYSGDCGSLTLLYCSDPNSSTATGLTPGETYKIRVYTWTATPNQTSTFDVCIRTPVPPIYVSTTDYTPEELVQDIFFEGSECALISNVTSSTGSNFGAANGIGYFTENGSGFPYTQETGELWNDGIVLVCGNANQAPGPNLNTIVNTPGWPGDEDLEDILDIPVGETNDATYIQFDFVPLINKIEFDFIFASEEYDAATFECTFSDSFAFIVTNLETGDVQNLAVIPGTDEPIQVTNIHPETFSCGAINEERFGTYYLGDQAPFAPINFNGRTRDMHAEGDVVPGQQYNIKIVIANEGDSSHASAIFLKGGSLSIGTVDLGGDLTVAEGTALCDLTETTIHSNLDPDLYTFVWYQNDDVIEGASGPDLLVDEAGTYRLEAEFLDLDCIFEGSVVVEFYPPVEEITGDPVDMVACDASGFSTFDLTPNIDEVLTGPDDPENFTVTIHTSLEDAEGDVGAITDLTAFTNTIPQQQTLYVKIIYNVTECTGIKTFDLIIQDLTPHFDFNEDFSICDGTSETITVTPQDFDPDSSDISISWTHEGDPLPDTGTSITVTEAGTYEVTINNSGCEATASVEVTVTPVPVAEILTDVTMCDSFTLQPLNAGSNYYTESGGQGTMLAAGDVITSTQMLYVFAESGTEPNCTDESSFTITIVPNPVVDDPKDVTACDSYTLPALTAGDYYTATGGTGTMLAAGDVITSTQTIYVYAESGSTPNCTDENSFVVTIVPTPVADDPADVDVCDSYTLPALTSGSYYTATGGGGTMLAAGDIITSTQTIYVFAENGACSDENEFVVTITPTPQFTLGGPFVVCDPGNAVIAVIPANFNTADATYAWTFNGDPITVTGSSIEATDFGTYGVIVTINNCTSAQGTVDVTQDTTVITATHEQGCDGNDYVVTVYDDEGNFNPDFASYSWTGPNAFSESGQQIIAPVDGTYVVTITTEDGCTGTHTVEVVDTTCDVQRGISPNNDELNDSFDLSSFNVTQLSIFNRYGKEVFSFSGNYTDEWEGQDKSGNELPTGTYFYMFERDNGESKTGWVYINREE